MLDAVRRFANRPLGDGERLRLFICALAVILAVAGVLALVGRGGSPPRREAAAPRATATVVAVPPATPTPAAPPSEEGPAAAMSHAEVRAAKRAARRFLSGYLAYSYGRGRPRAIRGAAPALSREIARHPPRVKKGVRSRRPRVRLVQSNGVGANQASLTALVADGSRVYTVALELARSSGGRWTVTGVEA